MRPSFVFTTIDLDWISKSRSCELTIRERRRPYRRMRVTPIQSAG
jgi:hypothetical protein